MSARACLRIDESVSEARAFRAEVTEWRKNWDAVDALGAHLTQLDVLARVVLGLADDIAAGSAAIEANAQEPVLTVEKTHAAPGGGGANDLVPGYLAVIRATQDQVPETELSIADGRLCRNGERLTGFDYMVLRIEGRKERDDWRTPDLDQAIRAAIEAKAMSHREEYERLRDDALSLIFRSPSLTPANQRQLVMTVREQLEAEVPGAAVSFLTAADATPVMTAGYGTVAAIVAERGLPSPDSVAHLTLGDLLSA